jgi:predicted transcriptional regulator
MEGAIDMKSQRLPDTEFEIMDYLWNLTPPVTTSMVMERIGREKGWKIQTVVSLFARLTERGFLRVQKGLGRERAFYPIISREEYLRMETECFVSHYHKNSYASLLGALKSERLTEAELDELAAWVRQKKGGGGQ